MNIKFKEINKKMDPLVLLSNVDESIAGIIDIDYDGEPIRNLIYSIEKNGQIDPVLVYKGKLVDGRHRCYACKQLGIDVIANTIDNSESIERVEAYITSKEMINKQLTPTQKAIIAYERYHIKHGHSLVKTAKESGVRRVNLVNLNYIYGNDYAQKHSYIDTLKKGLAVKLPNGKYSSSLQTIKNTLLSYEEGNIFRASEEDLEPDILIDYSRIFTEYDFEDRVSEAFWSLKKKLDINDTTSSIIIAYELLKAAYPDKYDFDEEITINTLKNLAIKEA